MNTTVDMPIALTGGVIYLLMALTMAGMLRSIPHAPVVRLWVAGSVCAGVALLLVAGRGVLPVFIGFHLVALFVGGGALLQTAALRRLLGLPGLDRRHLGLGLGVLVVCTALSLAEQRRALFAVVMLVLAVLFGLLAWHAGRTARQVRSGSAMLMAWSQAALVLALLARGASVAAGVSLFQHGSGGITFLLLHAVVVLTALYGSMGFMGLMLDLTRRAEARAREGQVAEATRRETAEQTAQELRALLAQRDTLATERERLLQMLAHEIRQPLHNASGALQAAGQALHLQSDAPGEPGEPQLGQVSQQVSQRLRRAEAVLGEVRSVLDNTLAAATLLSRSAPLAVQEVDLDFLIDLALGDLDEAQRSRVQVQWHTDLRHAEVEPGLLRLALRNLLANAFGHGGPDVAVQLQVDEQEQPPALVLRVVDDGPGLPAALPADAPGLRREGLGLHIVQQVVALHGGRLDLLPQAPRGLQAVLVLPLFVA